MKKNYRKLILVLAIIALCVSAISISDVYAKYVASANGAVDISKVTGYSIDGGTTTTLNSGTTNTKPTVITGTIPYAGTGTKTKTIRVFIKWVDDAASGATMTDAQDSEFTWDEANRQIKLKIDATFEQKV